jgi:hypothetical protein
VSIAFAQAEQAEDIDSGIHACHHGDAARWRSWQVARVETLGVCVSISQQIVGGHPSDVSRRFA